MIKELVLEVRGECNRCGYCCEGCRHLEPSYTSSEPSKYKCKIFDKLEEVCPECGHDHLACRLGPQRPLRGEHPTCSVRFYAKDSGAEVVGIREADWDFSSKHP